MKKKKINTNYTRWCIFSVLALTAGIIAGSIAAGVTDGQEIIDGLKYNISVHNGQALCFVHSAVQNLKITGLFWLMGMTVIGSFFIPILIAERGYAVGLSVGVLIKSQGAQGLITAAAGVLPHTLVILPAYILLSVLGVGFSEKLIIGERDTKKLFCRYTFGSILIFCVILIGCLIEGYISLSLVKLTL